MHHTVTDAFNEIIGYVFSIISHCMIMCLLQKSFWAVEVLNGAQGLTEDNNLSRKLVWLLWSQRFAKEPSLFGDTKFQMSRFN